VKLLKLKLNKQMKLWDKNISTEDKILQFTTGLDPQFDKLLAPYDILGSMAHVIMLSEINLLEKKEAQSIVSELESLYKEVVENGIDMDEGVEDIHTQVEIILTEKLGDLGKKIHTGRSRNDQVLVDIKLFMRDELKELVGLLEELIATLLKNSEESKDILMPGYTHFQVAMPSSFGLWFGAYAEALTDDLTFLSGAYSVLNQNPLGSAAGYGSSFPLDRVLTTSLLKFENLHVNVINAQLNRGKAEWYMASGISAIASSIGKMAMDSVLYASQNFGFIKLPDSLTTGSSIMPHKKNPDVLELIRAKCNMLAQLPSSVTAVLSNLPSGYHRDFQILKEILFPAIEDIKESIGIMDYVMKSVSVNPDILDDPRYHHLFTVEEVNNKVMQGIPFRDAYKEVARDIETGKYKPGKEHTHTHLGSIGDPGTKEIKTKLVGALARFNFADREEVLKLLTGYFSANGA